MRWSRVPTGSWPTRNITAFAHILSTRSVAIAGTNAYWLAANIRNDSDSALEDLFIRRNARLPQAVFIYLLALRADGLDE